MPSRSDKKPNGAAQARTKEHPGARSVGWALVQAARLHRARLGGRLGELGLFAGQEQVIQMLASAGPMAMGDLSAALRVRPPTASKTISRLASLRLVERRTERGDARIVRVSLTSKGREAALAIEALWQDVEREMLAGLDAKERKRLRKLLRRAASNLADATGADSLNFALGEEDADDLAEDISDESRAVLVA